MQIRRLLPFLGVMLAAEAAAQVPPPREPSPPIHDSPPPSPIDGFRPPSAAQVEKEVAVPVPPRPPPPPRETGAVWLGWTLGRGYGWHPRRQLERRVDLEVDPGFGPGHLGHFGPEIGYQWRDRLSFSLQTRHQVIPRQSSDPTQVDESKQWAHTLVARAIYVLYPDRFRRFRLYSGGVLGVGDGFRFRVEVAPSRTLATSDTVRGGPFVLGPIGGIIYPLADGLSVVGELRAMFGAFDPAGMADLSVGLQFDAFHL